MKLAWTQFLITLGVLLDTAVATPLALALPFPLPQIGPDPTDRLAPSQHRLAFAGADGMAVSWNTFDKIENPTVYYGNSPNSLNYTAHGESITYPTSTTYSNHVKLSGLEPGSVYYYKVSNAVDGMPIYNFTTAPKVGDKAPFEVAVAIDLGTMGPLGLSETTGEGDGGVLLPGERNTIDALKDNLGKFKFVWHPGDIAYADYWLKEQLHGYIESVPIDQGFKVYNAILNTFYDQLSTVSSYVPYMVGPGNHEANCNNGGTKDKKTGIKYTVDICIPGQTNFTGYRNHWRMPNEESKGRDNMWYSFDYGMVHFVQINTETDFGNGLIAPDEPKGYAKENAGPFGAYKNEQIDWLNKDLASVDRCKTPWVIVSGHRPWYTNSQDDACTLCQEAFEETLVKYGVDLAIFGHVHNYQRFNPIKFNVTDPKGLSNPDAPWYIINGAAGHYDGMDSFDTENPFPEAYKFGFDNTYGWSKLIVHNETHLTHEFIASRNDSVLDSATLFKKHTFGSQCKIVNNDVKAPGVSFIQTDEPKESESNNQTTPTTVPPQVNSAAGFKSGASVAFVAAIIAGAAFM